MMDGKLDIEMSEELCEWINQRVDEGRFIDADDYLRHLVRRDLERAEQAWLNEPVPPSESS